MPVLQAGNSTQVNRSGQVVRSGGQPCIGVSTQRQTCSRIIIPPTVEPAAANTHAIVNNANTQVLHAGSGVYTIEKTGGADSAYNADAVSSSGISGDFILRAHVIDDEINVFVGVSASPTGNSDYTTIDRGIQFYRPNSRVYFYESGVLNAGGDFVYVGTPTYVFIRRVGSAITVLSGTTAVLADATLQKTLTDLGGTVYFDSSIYDIGDKIEVMFYDLAALQASAATFVMTGNSASLSAVRRLTANAASYVLSGQTAALSAARRLTANLATYSISGQSAALNAQRRLALDTGSFVMTGQSAFLTRAVPLIALPAPYAMTGQSASLLAQRKIILDTGSFAMAEQSAGLSKQYRLALQTGVFAMAGQNAILAYSGTGSASARPRVTAFFYR